MNILEHGMEEGTLTSTSQGAKGNASNTPRREGNNVKAPGCGRACPRGALWVRVDSEGPTGTNPALV